MVHKVSIAGIEDLSWQFDTGDDVLGALAMADLDIDDEMEIIAASKSKTLFIINADGSTQAAYETEQYLTGTPAVGNIDDDPELEVVFGGYNN